MLRRSGLARRAPRPKVSMEALTPTLCRLGLANSLWPTEPLRLNSKGGSNHAAIDPLDCLAPLFSHHFTVEDRQYTALGDATVQTVLSDAVHRFLLYRQLCASPNVATQLVACFHNALAMRYLAESIGLVDLPNEAGVEREGTPLQEGETPEMAAVRSMVEQLREPPRGPSPSDVAGTAFAALPHAAATSAWGHKLSHLIGCIRLRLGRDAAVRAVETLWGLKPEDADVSNVPLIAVKFIATLVEHYPASMVAESLLNAQGLSSTFTVRHFPLPGAPSADGAGSETSADPLDEVDATNDEAHGSKRSSRSTTSTASSPATEGTNASAVATSAVSRAKPASSADADNALDVLLTQANSVAGDDNVRPLVSAVEARGSLAGGPGGVDLLAKFAARTSGDGVRATTKSDEADSEGWLPVSATRPPAATNDVTFASSATGDSYFADLVSVPAPVQGQYVAQIRPRNATKDADHDPDFYSALAEKDGINVETYGMPAVEYVRGFRQPGGRAFEVSLVVTSPTGSSVVASKAVGPHFTTARIGCAKGYLEGITIDLARLTRREAPPTH